MTRLQRLTLAYRYPSIAHTTFSPHLHKICYLNVSKYP
nr:MAG TPA: hypothetical protein [Caudoviricetes sp.]